MRIAISGNIAAGKSTVQEILQDLGYKVLDCDDVAHKLLTVKNKLLLDTFKDFEVFENGEFSREKVGNLVFHDFELKSKLESILFPQIRAEINKFFANNPEKTVFVGIPLLFEAGMEDMFDKIIFVDADDMLRIMRLIKRTGFSERYAKIRIQCQMPQDEKIKKSDFVIYNNGTKGKLKQKVTQVLNKMFSQE